jgi:glycosyltransferase involved in cell wall biosynthesis
MKVLMLTQYITVGGLERMIFLLSRELKRAHQLDVTVFSYDTKPTDPQALANELKREGVTVRLEPKGPGFSPATVRHIAEVLRRDKPEVMHTHDMGALVYGVLAKWFARSKVRIVHTQHSFIHITRSWKYSIYEKIFTRAVDRVVVVDEGLIAGYEKLRIPTGEILTIHNGVAFPNARVTASQRLDARRKLFTGALASAGLPESAIGDRWILSLARVHPRKGQDHVVALWNELPEETRARARVFLVGPETFPGERDRILKAIAVAKNPERLHMPGITSEPELWLAASDVYVSGSEYEGLPLGPIEAIGAGLPTVLSEIEGHQRLAGDAELYPLADPAVGARKLAATLRRAESGEEFFERQWAATQSMRERFSIGRMATDYLTKAYV